MNAMSARLAREDGYAHVALMAVDRRGADSFVGVVNHEHARR